MSLKGTQMIAGCCPQRPESDSKNDFDPESGRINPAFMKPLQGFCKCFDSIPRVEYNTRLSYLSPSGTSQILSKNLSYDLRPYHFRASVLPLFHTSHFGMLYRTAQNLIQYHDIYSVSRIYARETQFARERLSRYQRRVRSIVGDMHPYVFAQVSEFVALMQFPQ